MSFASPLFARLYDLTVRHKKRRKYLLSGLRGKVLELGAGTGANWPWYHQEVDLVALEPSAVMQERAAKRSHVCNLEQLTATTEDTQSQGLFPAASFDAIVCTLVLCSVDDYEQTIDYLISLLKPGGKLILLEHVYAKHPIYAWCQRLWEPVQCTCAGCSLLCKTDQYLHQQTQLTCQEEGYFWNWMWWYWGVWVKDG